VALAPALGAVGEDGLAAATVVGVALARAAGAGSGARQLEQMASARTATASRMRRGHGFVRAVVKGAERTAWGHRGQRRPDRRAPLTTPA
jgi:hypothetical protein